MLIYLYYIYVYIYTEVALGLGALSTRPLAYPPPKTTDT